MTRKAKAVCFAVIASAYKVQVWGDTADGGPLDEYTGGNSRFDSAAFVPLDDGAAESIETMRRYARQTAAEMAAQWGVEAPTYDRDLEESLREDYNEPRPIRYITTVNPLLAPGKTLHPMGAQTTLYDDLKTAALEAAELDCQVWAVEDITEPGAAQSLRIVEKPATTPVNVWFSDGDGKPSLAGYYWDTSEDSGGFDRNSPQGPFRYEADARIDAARLFGPVRVEQGPPSRYDDQAPGTCEA